MDLRCFSFGPFVLIPARQALLREGTPVRIGTRALEILSVLVQRPGTVIDKRELMSLVWADTFVDDSNLKVHIAALRKMLDENCSQSSCIATVIGRGYRFVEPVIDCATSRGAAEAEQLVSSRSRSEDTVQRLSAQVEWSLGPLPEKELLVLSRLATIEGYFDLDEGIAVVSGSTIGRAEAATCIANLVSKSLVERQGHSRVNFRLLKSVRCWALQQMASCARHAPRLARQDGLADSTFGELERDEYSSLFQDDGQTAYVVDAELGSSSSFPARALTM